MSLRVVIPARYESTRLPRKPLVDIGGKPMILHVVDRVRAALPDVQVTVATDNQIIVDELKAEVDVLLTSAEHQSGSDRIAEVASLRGWADSDAVINVQCDEPLIPEKLLAELSSLILANDVEMATACTAFERVEDLAIPQMVKVVLDQDDFALYFSRASIPFDRDGVDARLRLMNSFRHVGIYAYTVGALRKICASPQSALEQIEKLEQLRALHLGVRIKVMKWNEDLPHGVDTADDLDRVRGIVEGRI